MIRPLLADDFEAWQSLWLGYLTFYRAELSEEVTGATFARLVSNDPSLTGLVAEDDSLRVVGFAHLVFHASTWTTASYCYLEDLFLARPARGTGLGRDLLEAVFAEADRRGATRTYWETQEFNSPARSLYDQVARRTSFIIYER